MGPGLFRDVSSIYQPETIAGDKKKKKKNVTFYYHWGVPPKRIMFSAQ